VDISGRKSPVDNSLRSTQGNHTFAVPFMGALFLTGHDKSKLSKFTSFGYMFTSLIVVLAAARLLLNNV
jgi:hypothetical protein